MLSLNNFFIFATFVGNKSRRFPKKNAETGIKNIPKFVHRPFLSEVKGKLLGTRSYLTRWVHVHIYRFSKQNASVTSTHL